MMRRPEFLRHVRPLAAESTWNTEVFSWSFGVKPRTLRFPSTELVMRSHVENACGFDDWRLAPRLGVRISTRQSLDVPFLETRQSGESINE
jgi:hypothetical protein